MFMYDFQEQLRNLSQKPETHDYGEFMQGSIWICTCCQQSLPRMGTICNRGKHEP